MIWFWFKFKILVRAKCVRTNIVRAMAYIVATKLGIILSFSFFFLPSTMKLSMTMSVCLSVCDRTGLWNMKYDFEYKVKKFRACLNFFHLSFWGQKRVVKCFIFRSIHTCWSSKLASMIHQARISLQGNLEQLIICLETNLNSLSWYFAAF